MAFDLYSAVKDAKTIGITGHIKPDGDCIGSCLALMQYLRKRLPGAKIELFLEEPEKLMEGIPLRDQIISDFPERDAFDVFIVCDTNAGRTGDSQKYFKEAKLTINIDHHISNIDGTGQLNLVRPEAAACGQIIYGLIEKEYMDAQIAELLYMAITHDTGVFHYSNTTPETLRIAAELLEYDFDFSAMLDATFFSKPKETNMLLAHALIDQKFYYDEKLIIGYTSFKCMREVGATRDDTGGIVERLNLTRGIWCAIYIYEKKPGQWKASLRSTTDNMNVATVGEAFGGGGHKRAAGCEYNGTLEDFVAGLVKEVGRQLGM